jgi:hypothetical protein
MQDYQHIIFKVSLHKIDQKLFDKNQGLYLQLFRQAHIISLDQSTFKVK